MQKRGKYKTDIERKMEQALIDKNIPYIYDFPIRVKGYRIDFLILPRKLKLGIECDGECWHTEGNHHDIKRDNYLKRNGYTLLRFKGQDIKNNLPKCIDTIQEAIKFMEVKNGKN